MARTQSLASRVIIWCLVLLPSVCTAQFQWSMLLKGATVYPDATLRGVPSATGNPGARQEHAFAFDDTNNELWIFGGTSTVSGTSTYFYDVWKYTVSTGNWTWYGGSGSSSGTARSPGSQGVAASSNTPGARVGCVAWIDPTSGMFWVYGGSYISYYSDLWMFNPSTGYWTWVSGTTNTDTVGTYGSINTPSTGNHPGSRASAAAWYDGGNLYIFGGTFLIRTSGGQEVNNVMRYSIAANTWTWIAGTTVNRGAGSVGAKGAFSTSYYPSARAAGASGYDRANRQFWIYGGYTTTSAAMSDVWCFRLSDSAWAIMSAAQQDRLLPSFGPIGADSSSYSPGSASFAMGWFDSVDSTFWVLGGYGWDTARSTYSHISSSLWRFRVSTDSWTIMAGSNVTMPPASPTYVAPKVYTKGAVGWSQTLKTAFLYGGAPDTGSTNNELWKYALLPAPVAPPVAPPVTPPVAPPVAAPRAPPMAPPVAAPVASPRAAPSLAPISSPNPAPIAVPEASGPSPSASPIASPASGPVESPSGVVNTAPVGPSPAFEPGATPESLSSRPAASPFSAPVGPLAQVFVSLVGPSAPNSSLWIVFAMLSPAATLLHFR
eukprot:TRINITY_DN2504_c0_g1_i1.p1 TRINITY_DN2504_c0_g1~~TRINITY_DN2504_c0_g1_i1.p1  ORF type:complete len:603 (+),score=76.23 TRINITY_DN2504_c0_g1_i1:1137-2945(+)